ncbi:hypothetical protein LAZ67_6000173, partial [Cordylochernes scorpioides]
MAEEIILRLKKKRAVNRSYLTKTCNKIESGLDTLMRIELEELLEQLNESFNELKLVDHEIETLLETDDLEKELQGVEEYREKYITWRFRANKKIRQSDFHGENIPNSNSRIDENEMRHYVPSCTTVKLPKLMISKFYGNFSEWLTFWNSFDAAIHQNNSLNPIDKFNYLKSHLGGTALNTVEGFALSADNYEKAIKLLKDRFGREDILISRHMNNLLSMRPLKTSSDVRTFRELFDNLSVQIRSLESLNVSIDVYGQLLCPIIIKLLPADLNLELNKELPTGYVINDLITFLERQLTAREKSFRNEIGTGNESTSKPNLVNKHPKTRFYNEKPIATASELLNSVHKSNECVFCGKDNHGSPKCDFAANMSLNEKRSLMKKKGVCFKCLRPSHLSKFCRNVVRCSICNMSSHLDVMCTKLILDRGGSSKSPTVQDETLANLSTSPDVLLPTLRVTLKGNRTEKTARAIIDTGSQRSYILHSTAMEMEYEQSRREFFRHSLFGGSSTDVVEHEVYTIHLSDINNSYRCEFEALGQPLICGSIPPVCPRSFLEGSEELDVSDLMRDRIEVLIGADVAGRLLTDAQRRISSGLVAIHTKLGWTVLGKIPPTEVRDDTSSLCVTTLLSLDLENLWKLDAVGVSDAEVEKKTQSLQAEMEEHFAHTTTRDIEGRYEVALPWVQDKERIPSNRDLAENQLSSVRRKLEEVGDMNEYGQIFEECINQGIIEYSREDKLDGVHNLPHRPVYKRNSQTSKIRPVFNASARKRDKLSLNDCLDKGPNLIEIIPRLLNKFRKYEVGVSSDIEKAFLQIGIKEEDRDAAVFEIAGVDLTGHLILKNKKKAWIVIFTCAVYGGVHLELVTSLSMEAFLQAFRRFIARRGRPLIVYSDNGTNFKGMANALKKIDFSRLKCDPTLKNITWKFIPPGAPWWGGWWERLIGMMKQLLFRILGQTSLGYEELSTVMCDVESLMNTRPLTYLTKESEDLAPLTPSLFLHEVREVGVPDLDLIDNQTLSRKYQYIKRVREDLRERFRIEYFGFLRQETRRLKTTIPFKVGDMVLIGQESLKRLHWPLARIIQLYPGKDGLVRVAKVKTSSGDKIRPIQKLYNLEITPEIRCRDPLTERSPTQEVRLTTEEDPLTSQQEQHHIDTPNVVSSYGRPIKRPNRLDLLNFSFPCLSRRDANSKVGEMLEKKTSEAANGKPAEAATGMQRVDSIIEADETIRLEIMGEELKEIKEKIEKLYDELFSLDEVDIDKESEAYDGLMNKIGSLRVKIENERKLKDKLADIKPNGSQANIKLPQFDLPIYDGDMGTWINFKELFLTTIDAHPGLTNIQKLQYLNSAVKGEAARLIRGFPLLSENYGQAWNTLLSRYDNPRELAYAQVSKIFSLRAIKNPSAKCLHEFMDVCNEAIRNLETLELKRNQLVDVILVHFLQQKLSENLRLDWELSMDNTLPSYDKFIAFISRHARSMSCAVKECSKREETTGSRFPKCQSYGMLIEKSDTCILCKSKHHPLYMCSLFCKMPLKEKLNVVKGHKLCFNCLRKGHFSWNCRLNQRCKVCKGKHHTMIHYDKPSTEGASAQVENTTPKEHESAINLTNTQQANCNDSHVLLATARIKIKNGLGKLCTCRALLDSGSQVTMITKGCCERLGLVQRKSDRMIIGVGNTPVQHSSSTVSVTFCPLNNSEEFSVEAVVTGVLTSEIPNFRLKDPNWPTLKNLKLADPEFYIQAPIDMILGADIYTELMLNGSISLGEGLPMAINTRLGWVLLGKLMGTSESNTEVCNLSLQSEPELEFVMKRFWETESVPSPDLCTQDEDCERLFSNNHGRDSHGRYWVKLPFRQHRPLLGESREKALRRFLSLEGKLCKNVKLYDQYRGFMKEYEHLNHMERVPIAEVKRELCRCYYMPHHPEDADYQRILWRPSPEEPVVDYRLLTVTYGTTSAPFLAMRTLQQLAEDEGQNYPEASRVTLNDFYVDDLLTGAQTIAETKELIDQLKDLMKKGAFHLRKWNSNCHEIVSHVEEMNEEKKINLEKGAISKILGIVWDHVQDTFRVNITLPEEVVTKRDLLSNIARIFDPLGFLSPTTVAMANLQRQTAVKQVEDLEGLPVYHRAILKENGEWPEVTKAIQCSYPKVFVGDGTHLYLLIEDVESLDGPNVRSVLYQYHIPHKKWIWRKVNGFAPIVISKSIVYASHDKRVYFVGGRIHSRGNKVTCTDNIVRVKLKEGRASVLVKSRKSPLTDLLVLAMTFAPSAFLFMLAETRDHSTYKVFSYHLLNKDWHLIGSDKIFWKEKFLSLQICYTNKKLLLFPRMQWEQHFCNLYNYRLQTDSWGCYTTIPILGEKEGYPKNINHFTIVQDWVRAVFVHAGKESKYLWKLNLKSKQWTELPTYVKYRDSQYTAVALDLVFILGPADKEHETAEKYLSFFKTRRFPLTSYSIKSVTHTKAFIRDLPHTDSPNWFKPPGGGQRDERLQGADLGGSRGAARDGHAVLAHQHTHCASHVGASPPGRRSHLAVSPALGACRRRALHQPGVLISPSLLLRGPCSGHRTAASPARPASSGAPGVEPARLHRLRLQRPVAGSSLLVLQRRPPSHPRGVLHHRAAAGPAILDLRGGPRGTRHHHLLSGKACHLRFLRRSRNAWCHWGPIGDLPSNSAAVAEAP